MGFFANIKNKLTTTLMGELITDLGALPIDDSGREISLAFRRHPGRPAHLQVKLASAGETHHFQIHSSPKWADQFERVAREMRIHLESTAR